MFGGKKNTSLSEKKASLKKVAANVGAIGYHGGRIMQRVETFPKEEVFNPLWPMLSESDDVALPNREQMEAILTSVTHHRKALERRCKEMLSDLNEAENNLKQLLED